MLGGVTGLCITVCEQYMFYLYDTHLCVCYSPSALAMFPGGWNAVTVMIDSRTSSTDTSLFKERSTASRFPLSLSLPCSLTPLFFCLSLSSAGSPIFLALSCWQAIWSEPKIKLYPGSWGCWWREEQRFQLRPCVWESVCVCVSATGWLGNWCDSFVALVIPACRSRVL